MTLNARDPIALTQALVRCESVTPNEGGALNLLQGILQDAGFTCKRLPFSEPETPDVDNLYARIGSSAPHLSFAGHTDVVPAGDITAWTYPPFGGEIHEGTLYGRGAVDMKGGVACFVAAALRYLDQNNGQPTGSISLLITGDEEGPAINGTMKLVEWLKTTDEAIDACLVGEPSSPEMLGQEIRIGRRGSLNAELIVHGKQGHSAYPQKADNPIPKLARIIDRVSGTNIDDGSEHFQPSNLQVTIVSVPNTATNVIPAEARATLNIRYNDHWNRKTMEAWLREQVARAASSINASFDINFSGTGDVFLTAPEGKFVESMQAASVDVTGLTPALTTGGGTSDARFIKDLCPVIEFGLVNKTIHAVDEHTSTKDLADLTEIYQNFLSRYFA